MLDDYGVSTRYYGPTDHRGSRIRVTCRGKHKFIPYDYAANDAHEAAIHEAMPYLVDGVSMVESVRFIADTGSGRESDRAWVYLVTVSLMERSA